MASKNPKKPAESTKINKKSLFSKKFQFYLKWEADLSNEINLDIKILKTTFCSSGNIKILPKSISEYRLIIDYASSSAFYWLIKNHITEEESTNTFSNSTLRINKVNTTTTLEDIEEAFIYRDIPIKNLKRCTKADGKAMTLVTFALVNNQIGLSCWRVDYQLTIRKKS